MHAVFHVYDPATTAKHWGSIFGLPVIESEDVSFSHKIDDKSFAFVKGEYVFIYIMFNIDGNVILVCQHVPYFSFVLIRL
ncbi:hypothetical protein D3C76_1818240 [compost metagenome]